MADSIDAVKRALLNDLRARLGDHFSGPNQDPVQDITLIAPEVFDVKARAPQIVLTDFTKIPSLWSSQCFKVVNEDRAGGTYDEIRDPRYYDLEFTVTAIARQHTAAERMAEDLAIYFDQYPPALDVLIEVAGAQYTFTFPKRIVSGFREATDPDDSGLRFQECRAAVMGVPVFDGQVTGRRMVKSVDVEIVDGEIDEDDPTARNGDLLATQEVSID